MEKMENNKRIKSPVDLNKFNLVSRSIFLPDPACSVWPVGNVRHEGLLSHLGTGAEVMSSSDQQYQMWSGRKDPWVPSEVIQTQAIKHEEKTASCIEFNFGT